MDIDTVAPREIPDGAHLIDVREQDEWDAGHAPQARHLPASTFMEHLDALPEDDEPLYIVCRSGGRSAQVSMWLNQNGFEAVNVGGGMDIWYESALPMVSEKDAEPYVL